MIITTPSRGVYSGVFPGSHFLRDNRGLEGLRQNTLSFWKIQKLKKVANCVGRFLSWLYLVTPRISCHDWRLPKTKKNPYPSDKHGGQTKHCGQLLGRRQSCCTSVASPPAVSIPQACKRKLETAKRTTVSSCYTTVLTARMSTSSVNNHWMKLSFYKTCRVQGPEDQMNAEYVQPVAWGGGGGWQSGEIMNKHVCLWRWACWFKQARPAEMRQKNRIG